jgi:hypothetical protein
MVPMGKGIGGVVTYYRNGGISVDQDFARFGSKSYAINKINTVDVRERNPHGVAMTTIGALLSLVMIIVMFSDPNIASGFWLLVFLGLTYWGYVRSQIVIYDLYLKTSSSDVQAYESRDEDEVFKLRDAVEHAMTGR